MADNNQEDLKVNAVSSVPAPTEIPVRRTTSISRLTSNDAEVSSVDSGGRMISLAAKPPQQVKTESPQTTVSLSPDHQEMTTSLSASDHHHHDNMVAAITTTSTANESSPIPISVAESTSMMRDSSATVLINNKSKVPVTSVKSIFQESSSSNTLSSQPSMAGGVAGAPPKHPSANVSTASIKPDDSSTTSGSRIRLGICAMDKKARSKPMAEILSRLNKSLFELVFFGDQMILTKSIQEWPIVDVLIAFYSSGYPLSKAEQYVELRQPFVLNDLKMQHVLKDRRKVYDLLEEIGVDVPRHVYLNRDDPDHKDDELVEYDDHIEINGEVIHKPFLEKPVDADDHNIAIYYPTSAGGGCKKLFRKIGDRSSEFYPDIHNVRRTGSYIYEEFVETQGTDVKMYTVGPDYGHAEARKSPTVDGKVERNTDGKEMRFPVILTLREKEIARRIVIKFKQQVCGFDLLRVQQGDSLISYVCDVNGWSFVKNSRKYYDDCAQILQEHMLAAIRPNNFNFFSALNPLMAEIRDGAWAKNKSRSSTPQKKKKKATSGRPPKSLKGENSMLNRNGSLSLESGSESPHPLSTTVDSGFRPIKDFPSVLANEPAASLCTSAASSIVDESEFTNNSSTTPSSQTSATQQTHEEELRCVISIIRHGDRTPKQKLKMKISEPIVLSYFHRHSKNCRKDLKVKDKAPMIEFLETVRELIAEKRRTIDRNNSKERELLLRLNHMKEVLERWKIGGLNRKLQIKPKKWEEAQIDGSPALRCTEVLLILKWGGNLTKLGEKQAINLGQRLRHLLYPDAPGGGILRLHSTFRHDLKIKTSDEGRVMKTAAAFAKGMLELEGEIPPILVSLVHKEKDSLHMLDPSGNKEVKDELERCKMNININLQKDVNYEDMSAEEREEIVGSKSLISLHEALKEVHNPRKTLVEIHKIIGGLIDQLDEMLGVMMSGDEDRIEGGEGLKTESAKEEALSGIKLYKGETILELTERWRFIYQKLYDEETDTFDLSRIPDVHDNARFDMLHNPHLGLRGTLEKLYELAKLMADCVVPQEYGSTIDEKRSIGNKMCRALLEKIKYDLIIARTDNQVDMRYMINMDYSSDLQINTLGRRIRTRLYFTSESHLHTMLNVLRYPSVESGSKSCFLSKSGLDHISRSPELCYLTQIVIRLFEDPKKAIDDPKRFRVEFLFSPGVTTMPTSNADKSRFDTAPLVLLSKDYLSCAEVEDYFSESIREGETIDDDDASYASLASLSAIEAAKKEKLSQQNSSRPGSSSSLASLLSSPANNLKGILSGTITTNNNNSQNETFDEQAKPKDKNIFFVKEEDEEEEDFIDEGKEQEADGIKTTPRTRNNNSSDRKSELSVTDTKQESNDTNPSSDGIDEKNNDDNGDEDRVEIMARQMARRYIWRSGIAAVSLVLGIGCLFLSRFQNDYTIRRKFSKK